MCRREKPGSGSRCNVSAYLLGFRQHQRDSEGHEPVALDIPKPLDRIIKTCLAKDPDERFQNALDLKRDLLWATEEGQSPTPSRSISLLMVIAGLFAISATWFLALRFSNQAGPDPPVIQVDVGRGQIAIFRHPTAPLE